GISGGCCAISEKELHLSLEVRRNVPLRAPKRLNEAARCRPIAQADVFANQQSANYEALLLNLGGGFTHVLQHPGLVERLQPQRQMVCRRLGPLRWRRRGQEQASPQCMERYGAGR